VGRAIRRRGVEESNAGELDGGEGAMLDN
jgi:hypothetical protein